MPAQPRRTEASRRSSGGRVTGSALAAGWPPLGASVALFSRTFSSAIFAVVIVSRHVNLFALGLHGPAFAEAPAGKRDALAAEALAEAARTRCLRPRGIANYRWPRHFAMCEGGTAILALP